jgi:penicillin-binding protein 1C
MVWYYKSQHIEYLPLPPFRSDCMGTNGYNGFYLSKTNSKIYLTKNFNSEIRDFKSGPFATESKLFWYVDNVFKGRTKTFMKCLFRQRQDYITVDEFGNGNSRKIEIVE